jgi:hypothetical protein
MTLKVAPNILGSAITFPHVVNLLVGWGKVLSQTQTCTNAFKQRAGTRYGGVYLV